MKNGPTGAASAARGRSASRRPAQEKKKPIFYGVVARGYFDLTFFSLVIILLSIGLVALYSASNVYALQYEGNSAYYLIRQLIFAVVGLAFMWLVSNINYNILKKFTKWLYLLSIVLLVVVLFMPARSGAHRWIFIGGFSFQPSEIAKISMIIVFAKIFADYNQRRAALNVKKRFLGSIIYPLILLMPVMFLLYKEPHMSGIVIFVALTAVMMWVGGVHWACFVALFGSIAVALAALVLSGKIQYWLDRVSYWTDPWSDALGKGYQTIQSLYAIASGGIWGRGLGNSLQKHLYVPEPQNDFVFSIFCEEFGLIGAIIVIALFVALIIRGIKIAMHARDKFGCMLVTGITAQIGLQALLNIAVVTGTIPNTGISLPFFSSGGTALVLILAEVGVILSVSRSASLDNAV